MPGQRQQLNGRRPSVQPNDEAPSPSTILADLPLGRRPRSALCRGRISDDDDAFFCDYLYVYSY